MGARSALPGSPFPAQEQLLRRAAWLPSSRLSIWHARLRKRRAYHADQARRRSSRSGQIGRVCFGQSRQKSGFFSFRRRSNVSTRGKACDLAWRTRPAADMDRASILTFLPLKACARVPCSPLRWRLVQRMMPAACSKLADS